MANSKKVAEVKDAVAAWTHVEEEANAKAVNSPRIIHKMEIGQYVRQGDVYVVMVKPDHKRGKERTQNRQVALGNTQGSRHIALAPAQLFEGVAAPEKWSERTFLGPVVESKAQWTLEHPEHAHMVLPAGTYQVCHQMDARTLERVRD